jgi:hypothetical protein
MFWGEGRDYAKAAIYKQTKDLKRVFNYILPIDGDNQFEGVPGTFQDAWGKELYQEGLRIAQIPHPPDRGLFLPAEESAGPTNTVLDDMWSKFTYERNVDVPATFQNTQNVWNQQAEGFTSSVSDEDIIAGAKNYYAAHDAFWQKNAPDFYREDYKPWFDSKVAPKLGV